MISETKSSTRKEDILDSALLLMNESGLESVSMDEIARKTGISKGALYLEFESKTDLIVSLSARFSEQLNRQFSQALVLSVSGLDILKEFGAIYLRFVHENPLFVMTLHTYQRVQMDGKAVNIPSAAVCKSLENDALTYVVRAAQIGIQDGSIVSKLDPKTLAMLIFAGFKGLTDLFHMATNTTDFGHTADLIDLEEMMRIYMEIMERGISA
jgi:AcrR family transcriptional regulator